MVIRNSGHMVPISQPRWAEQLVYEFTYLDESERWKKPKEKRKLVHSSFENCGWDEDELD